MYNQRPPGPLPPPPPPFQQGTSAPPHPIMQQGALPVQPHVGNQPGQPVYQHAPPPPPPHAPVQQGSQVHSGMLKLGQSYLHPPPQFHGSVPLPHLYPSSNHNSLYSAHFLQIPPPLPPHTENLRAPPPPPPSQGQTQYRALGMSEAGGVQGLHYVQLPPPPPRPQLPTPPPATSSYLSTTAYESFLRPTLGASPMPTMAPPPPPPLPSSPPPLSPSPPLPPSPLPFSGTSPVPIIDASQLPSISSSDKVYGSQSQNVTSANHTRDNATMSDGSINCIESAGLAMGSNVKDGFSDKDIILRPPESQSYSPADCDMEMEDDMQVHHSLDEPNPECVMIRDELDVDEQLTASEGPPLYNLSVSGYSRLAAHGGVSESPPDRINLEKPSAFVTGVSRVSNAWTGSGDNDAGKPSGQHSTGDSPFRLLQDYASDDSTDNSEPCLYNPSPIKVSSPFTVSGSNLNIDPSHNLEPDVSKSPYKDESESRSLFQEALAFSPSRTSINDPNLSLESNLNVENTALSSVPSLLAVKSDEQHDGGTKSINHYTSKDNVKKEDAALDGVNVSDILESGNSLSKDRKCVSPLLKVDEFGRLVRKKESDSESDDFRSKRRRGKKGRSRSRSLSPRDKWRRRRSPSRSRSHKRSRSRSPINRRGADYGSEKMKRGKDHIPYCMDFYRGKCHRGASCRFLHPESDKIAGSKRYKSKHQKEETSPSLKQKKVLDIQISEGIMLFNSDQGGQLLGTDVDKYERSIETDTQVHKSRQAEEEIAEQTSHRDNDNRHKVVDTYQPFLVPAKSVSEPEDTAELVLSSVAVFQKADHNPRQVDGCSTSDSMGHPFSSNNSSQLPLPPPPPLSQSMNAPSMPRLSNDYNLMQATASLPYQSVPGIDICAYQAPIPSQQPQFSIPPNSTWTPLPPPPPLAVNHSIVKEAVAIPGNPQFQQNRVPPTNNLSSQTFFRPYLTNVPIHSHLSEFQHGHLFVQEHHQAPLPVSNSLQPFAGTNLIDFPSSSYAQGNIHTQTLPPNELYKASSVNYPFSHQQPQLNVLQYSAPHENLPGNTMASTTRLLSDILEKNQMSSLPDFAETKIPSHYNPYASTFDQPLSSKFSSSSFRQENNTPSCNKYDAPISLSHLPVDGLGAGSIGSRQMSTSNSAKAVPSSLPTSGDDQYDPLFDSIEKSQRLLGKYDRVQKWDCTNDEFGETADAEVGAVENDSPSSPIDMENTSAGEIEIDQSKSPGKRKKSKDSKSMKLFRIAIADFVKEVLKPSWRQGNMSKEAFKTIVKKTVDKVSGALKGHQAPKSEAKINQYIDSSQQKLTKLIMGYVDKYVKV